MPTQITVPATVANLGAGFDIFALALELHNEVTAQKTGDAPLTIDPGEGAAEELRDPERNLVARAFTLACAELGVPGGGAHLACVNRVPFARGLGSSAAAALSGILAALELHDAAWDQTAILACVTRLEGHSDNAAAALLGGLSISAPGAPTVSIDIPDDLRAVIFIPRAELRTDESRRVVPTTLSRADAVFNASRCALLVRSLALRDYELLGAAMEDRWHQQARSALFPAIPQLIAAAREAGARGAALAGAGPSVIALCDSGSEQVGAALGDAAHAAGVPGSCLVSRIPNRGAQVVSTP